VFPIFSATETYAYIKLKWAGTWAVTNTTIDVGLFASAAANPYAPTDGVFLRTNSTGVFGVSSVNGTEQTTTPFKILNGGADFVPVLGTVYDFIVTSSSRRIVFWLDMSSFRTLSSSTTASVKQKETISFTGTGGTANVTGAGGLTKLATFRDDLTTTAIDFESAHGAAYAVGITLTRNMGDIILEATVAGVPFTAPVVTNVTANLGGTVAHTTANYTATAMEFDSMALVNGGGGTIKDVKIETNITAFAAKGFRLWLNIVYLLNCSPKYCPNF